MLTMWLISYIFLWIIVVLGGLIILALAREIEVLHKHQESLHSYLSKVETNFHHYYHPSDDET